MGGFWHGLAMRLYRVGIGLAAACGHAKARGWLAMRKGRMEELSVATSRLKPGQQWMWFHCASVGEYEQARPVMEAWRSLHPGDAFLLSFYSASGWDAFIRRQPEWWTAADHVTAMPLDVRSSMRLFVQAAGGAERLRGLLFAKYDVWPTLVSFLTQARVPVGLFAGHVLPGRWPFRWGGGYQRQAWKEMRRVWVQTEASLPTLSAYGVNAEVAGDPRFDRVLDAVGQHQPDQALQTWVNDRPCLVVGSAWQPEWDAAREAWQEGQCVIVVPHEWTAESIANEASRWEAMGANPWYGVLTEAVMRVRHCPKAMCSSLMPWGSCWTPMRWLTLWSLEVDSATAFTTRSNQRPMASEFWSVRRWTICRGGALRAIDALSVCDSPSALREAIQTALQDEEVTRRAGAKAAAYARENAGAGMAIAQGWSNAL